MSLFRNQYLLFVLRIFLGGMFIYAALPKIMGPFDFAVAVYNYKLLPDVAVGPVAAGLPWLEVIMGALLVLGIRIRAASLTCTGLLVVFTLALLINTLRGINVDCGCFTSDRTIGWYAVAEDTLFTLLALWYFLRGENFWSVENRIVRNRRATT